VKAGADVADGGKSVSEDVGMEVGAVLGVEELLGVGRAPHANCVNAINRLSVTVRLNLKFLMTQAPFERTFVLIIRV